MQIEHIEIKNYRAFCHAVLDDLPPIAVVVGANGLGEFNTLQRFQLSQGRRRLT